MPRASVNGVDLFYEDTGEGPSVVFCHEFAGDYRSWDPQVRAFGRSYRCVTFSYRGFPPSSVPDRAEDYSQDHLIEDLRALVDYLGIQQAHFVGFSMGGGVVLNFAIRYPSLCRSVAIVGAGSGTTNRERFESDIERTVALLRDRGIQEFAQVYSEGPTRQPFKRKDRHGWEAFRRQLGEHSALGQAWTMEGVMLKRPTIFALEDRLHHLDVPALIAIGDEDEPCIEPAVFMKRHLPSAGLAVFPQSGHAINLEEPALFNAALLEFFRLVETGRWARRSSVVATFLPDSEARHDDR